MEDIKAYIESGILELYVLGDASPEERLQVEEMAAKHPAVKAELDEIERSMESYALENAIDPSPHLREKILNSLLTNFGDDRTFGAMPGAAPEVKVVTMAPRANSFYKYAFAACLVLLLGSVALTVSLYNKLQDSNTRIAALTTDRDKFVKVANFRDSELNVLQDKSFKFLTMAGAPKTPGSKLIVAWNPTTKKVWLDMRDAQMPANDSEHQYQLWALVGKKTISLGVFDAKGDTTDMKEMQETAMADAFAVTLEPRGGSPSPHLENLTVIGKF